jgi:hypothetical protein
MVVQCAYQPPFCDLIGFDTQIMPQVGGCDVSHSISAKLSRGGLKHDSRLSDIERHDGLGSQESARESFG